MKLAIISLMSGSEWGGSEMLWSKLALYALQKGDSVAISVYKWDSTPKAINELKLAGAQVHFRERYEHNPPINKKIKQYFRGRYPSLSKDFQWLERFDPDHIFISQGETFDLAIHHFSLYEMIARKGYTYSLVCHSHIQFSSLPPYQIFPKAIDCFANARFVFFVSKRHVKIAERQLATTLANARITWNPLNMKIPASVIDMNSQELIQYALVGNISGSKGHDTILEILASDTWKQYAWILNIYGSGPGEKYIRALATFYGISHRIKFHGYVDDISSIWNNNQVFLLPSSSEGMPISLVEAMLSGRVCIATDVGGVSELIIDGITGFLADAPSVKSFGDALLRAWHLKQDWGKIGKQARANALQALDLNPEETLYKMLADN